VGIDYATASTSNYVLHEAILKKFAFAAACQPDHVCVVFSVLCGDFELWKKWKSSSFAQYEVVSGPAKHI
jgi:hypothetical protein